MRRTEHVSAFDCAVTDGEPLLVDAKELRFVHTIPQRHPVGAQRLNPVNVGGQYETFTKDRRQPMRERAGDPRGQRQNALTLEHTIGFLVIRICIVARNCQKHWRHPERQRNLASGGVFCFEEIHIPRA
jgi:hypothetical protein